MTEVTIHTIEEEDLDTILAEDIDFTGELVFKKPLMIKGKFSGEINATGDLYIGENAKVEAAVKANIVSLKGRLRGNIKAKSRVELFSTASVDGDITTTELVMEGGSKFNGQCRMNDDGGEKRNV